MTARASRTRLAIRRSSTGRARRAAATHLSGQLEDESQRVLRRIYKHKDPELLSGLQPDHGIADPRPETRAVHYVAQAKVTSTLTNRLLLEFGYSTNIERLSQSYQPAIRSHRFAKPFTDVVFERDALGVERQHLGRFTQRVHGHLSGPPRRVVITVLRDRRAQPQRSACSGRSAWTATRGFAPAIWFRTTSTRVRRAAVPGNTVELRAQQRHRLQHTGSLLRYVNRDLGIYAQDTWTFKRLTVSPGIRFENFNAKSQGGCP